MSKENQLDGLDDKAYLITINGRQRRVDRDVYRTRFLGHTFALRGMA